MKPKYVAFSLIVTILLSSISFNINAEQPSFANDIFDEYEVRQMAERLSEKYEKDEEGAKIYVESVVGSKNYRTKNGRVVNIAILKDFNKLVYTYPKYDHYEYKGQGDYQKDEKGEWHYKILGYLYNDATEVTNPHFPNTAGTTHFFSTYMDKNWIETSGANKTWLIDDALAEHMLSFKRIYAQDSGGYISGNINIKDDVLGGKSIDEAMNYAIYQTPSTLKMTGSVRLYHMLSSGSTYYRTLDVAPVPFSLPQLKMSVEKPLYEFGQEEMTKTIKVTAEVYFDDFQMIDDWEMRDYIDHAFIEVNGEKQKAFFQNGTLEAEFEFEEPRTKFKSGIEHSIKYKGRAVVVAQEIFKDEFVCLGETSTKVVVNPGDVDPFFLIKNGDDDVTDGVIEYKNWEDVNLVLEPNNKIGGINKITDVLWTLEGSPNEFKYGNQNVNYKMTESKLASHSDGSGTATFTMKIFTKHKFDYGSLKGVNSVIVPHTVTFKKVEDPIEMTEEPVAKLRAPRRVRMGDVFNLNGSKSYDPDGEIVDYDFKLTAIRELEYKNSEKSIVKATVMSTSDNDVKLIVTDNDGLTDSTTEDIEILPPIEAKMRVDGYRKVNRKVILNASESEYSKYFPIDEYLWTITPLEGQSTSSIKYESNNKGKIVNVLFKEEGAYQVTLDLHAQCTLQGDEDYEAEDSISFPIDIQPDLKPTAGLTTISLALRDKMDGLQASIDILDTSYSEDGDQILIKQWYVRHDTDNDGNKADETWVSIGTAQVHEIYKTWELGDYDFYNEVVEVIPEEDTISKFLTEEDYLTDNSLDQSYGERHCHVDNVAPIISTTAELKKEIELLVITDEDGENYTNLLSEINKLTKEMYERKFGVNHEIIHTNSDVSKATIGKRKEQTTYWHRYAVLTLEYFKKVVHSGFYNKTTIDKPAYTGRSVIIDTKQGTIDEMLDFPTYPDAYASQHNFGWLYEKDGRTADNYYWRDAMWNIYNGTNDYLTRVTFPDIHVFHNSQSDSWWYYSSDDYQGQYFWDANNTPRLTSVSVDSTWRQGAFISESESAYNVFMVESYIDQYKDCDNDKYLIFAFADGRNLYLPDKVKHKIEEYGFKVYFSLDDFWGEFTPNPPGVAELDFREDGSMVINTKYNNKFEITTDTPLEKVYYRSIDEEYNFTRSLDGFSKLDPVLDSFTVIDISGDLDASYRCDSSWWRYGGYIASNAYATGKRYSIGEEVEFAYYGKGLEPITFNKVYTNGYISVAETSAGVKFISPQGNGSQSISNYYHDNRYDRNKLFDLDLVDIEEVYSFVASPRYLKYYPLEEYNDYYLDSYEGKEPYLVVKDSTGKYALLNFKTTFSHWYNESLGHCFAVSISPKIYYFNSLDDFDFHIESNTYKYQMANQDTRNRYGSYGDRNAALQIPSTVLEWILVDKNKRVYVNGIYAGKGDTKPRLRFNTNMYRAKYIGWVGQENDTYAWIKDGKVYGYGNSSKGQLGTTNAVTSPTEVLHSPYVLDAPYSAETFVSAYDISSSSPAYVMVNRGAYSDITAKLLEEYADYEDTETIFIQVGDTIDIGGFVLDYEGDPIYEKRIDVAHDNSYFDNASTPWPPPADFDEPVTVDVPGKMEIRLRAQDNPVGQDERFAEYRYWNKDNTSIEVIAHRPPVAKLGYALVPQGDGSFNFSGTDMGSYDLDHSLSRNDKGIVARKFYYRKELDPTWTEFSGMLPIQNDLQYQFALRVQDLEGAWSDYDIVDIEIKGEPFILNAGLSPATLPAGSSVEIEGLVFTYKAIQSVTASVDGVNVPLSKTDTNGMENTYKAVYTVPQTKADGPYPVLVTATAVDGTSRVLPLELLVNTPISVTGQVIPDTLKKGQVGRLTAQTEAYASSCSVKLFEGTPDMVQVSLSKDGAPVNGKQKWQGTYTFNENRPEGAYRAIFEANTPNGNTGEYVDTFTFIPNQPPSVAYVNKMPQFVYVSDDVTLNFLPTDPDGDPLDFLAEVSRDGGASWQVVASENVPSGISQLVVVENAVLGTCRVRVRVSDPLGEEATAQTSFTVNSLGVTGQVDHTQQWNENRIAYNESKGGGSESPRSYTTFWPGERFKLTGFSTKIHSDSDVKCVSLTVEIKSKSYKESLGKDSSKSTSDADGWSGEIWDKSMLEWKSQPLIFVFTATYSNGFVAVEEVQVNIDSTEDYWQHHRIF